MEEQEALRYAVEAARAAQAAAEKAAARPPSPAEWIGNVEAFAEMVLALGGAFAVVCVVIYVAVNHNGIASKLNTLVSISAGGVSLNFDLARRSLDASIEKYELRKTVGGEVSEADRDFLLRRLSYIGPIARDRRILWVDDVPANNDYERVFLQALGVKVYFASSNEAALRLLGGADYDVIISDIARPPGEPIGMEIVPELQSARIATPIIFYITDYKPQPTDPRIFGLTSRPDELMHLVFDAFARSIPE